MSSQHDTTNLPPQLDLSGWRKLPAVLMVVGGILSVIGLCSKVRQEFGYSWLLAFMFFLTLALGALFLVMAHHLTDAGWSVATRRFCEHHRRAAVSVAGDFVCAGDFAGGQNLPVADAESCRRPRVERKNAAVHAARLLRRVGNFLRHLVAAVVAPAFLVT